MAKKIYRVTNETGETIMLLISRSVDCFNFNNFTASMAKNLKIEELFDKPIAQSVG